MTSTTKKKGRCEQWFTFQKIWLANLRRDLLGTEETFGNPIECQEGGEHRALPDLALEPHSASLRPTLILDLDETLVHTQFDQSKGWITHRRPGVATFLAALHTEYEIVTFTSGLREYAEPIIDLIDPRGLIAHRLYREHTRVINGIHVKDLSRLNRSLARTVIVDNSPESYLLQPENAVPVKPFFGSPCDQGLLELIPFLAAIAADNVPDVRKVLKKCHKNGSFSVSTQKGRRRKGGGASEEGGKERRVSDEGARSRSEGGGGGGEEEGVQRRWSDLDKAKVPQDLECWLAELGVGGAEAAAAAQARWEGGAAAEADERHTTRTGAEADDAHRAIRIHVGPDAAVPLWSGPGWGWEGGGAGAEHKQLQRAKTEGALLSSHHDADASSSSSSSASPDDPSRARDQQGGEEVRGLSGGACAEVLRGMSPPPSLLLPAARTQTRAA